MIQKELFKGCSENLLKFHRENVEGNRCNFFVPFIPNYWSCVCVQCLCSCMLTHVETQSLHQVSFSTVLHFIELTALVGIDSQFAPGLSCLCVLSAEVIDRLLCLPGCMWALEIQTQVLVLVWHTFSPLSHLPSPQVKLFLNYFSKLFIFPICRRNFCKGFHT